MALAAAGASTAVWRFGGGLAARLSIAAALTFAPILMVYAGSGPWQPDWHMYFFVIFGMLVVYVDWRAIVLSTVLTAAHHAILAWLFPSAVFPEADVQRVILHAAIVGVDAVVLFFLVHRMRDLFANIEQANGDLETRIAERTIEVNELNRQLTKASANSNARSPNSKTMQPSVMLRRRAWIIFHTTIWYPAYRIACC